MNNASKNRFFKFISFSNLVVGLILGFLITSIYLKTFLGWWKVEYNVIFQEYLKIIFSFPAVLFFIIIFFLNKFSSAVDFFIRNLKLKYKDLEASSQRFSLPPSSDPLIDKEDKEEIVKLSKEDVQEIAVNFQELQKTNLNNQDLISKQSNLISSLANRAELFEFAYLNLYLVFNTKLVLRGIYKAGRISKDLLIQQIFVSPNVSDQYSEKLAIYNALLINGLIEETDSIVIATQKAERFLQFIGLNN